MWPAFSHQKPGRTLVVFVEPVREAGRGCGGERGSRLAQAAVPGSSEPSGQSQLLSLTWEDLMMIEGWAMHMNVSALGAKNLATMARNISSLSVYQWVKGHISPAVTYIRGQHLGAGQSSQQLPQPESWHPRALTDLSASSLDSSILLQQKKERWQVSWQG